MGFFKCVFHACFMLIGSWKGENNFRVGIFVSKLVRVRLQETNYFLGLKLQYIEKYCK